MPMIGLSWGIQKLIRCVQFSSDPAKFRLQLPGAFIRGLTNPGDVVLDPMMGSGTNALDLLNSATRPLL
jgi:DNA modification methylase